MMRRLSWLVVVLILVAGGSVEVSGQEFDIPEERIVLTFDPPLGVPIMQTYVQTSVQKFPAVTRERRSRAKGELRFEETTDGWLMYAKVLESSMRIDGEEVDSPLVSELVGLETTSVLDANAQLVEIRGYEELWRRLEKHFPAETMQQLKGVVGPEALRNKEQAEWAGRIGDFAGAEVGIGDVFELESEFPLPGGEFLMFHTFVTIASWEDCGTIRCLRIETEYTTDEADMSGVIAPLAPEGDSPRFSTRIEGGGYRLLDPSTMNIHAKRLERTMRMTIQSESGPVPVEQVEVREYEYEYP